MLRIKYLVSITLIVIFSACAHKQIQFGKKRKQVVVEQFLEDTTAMLAQVNLEQSEVSFPSQKIETSTRRKQTRTPLIERVVKTPIIEKSILRNRFIQKVIPSRKQAKNEYKKLYRGKYDTTLLVNIGIGLVIFGVLLLLTAFIIGAAAGPNYLSGIFSGGGSGWTSSLDLGCFIVIIVLIILFIVFALLVVYVFGFINSIIVGAGCIVLGAFLWIFGELRGSQNN